MCERAVGRLAVLFTSSRGPRKTVSRPTRTLNQEVEKLDRAPGSADWVYLLLGVTAFRSPLRGYKRYGIILFARCASANARCQRIRAR